jgi:hypothetical protein
MKVIFCSIVRNVSIPLAKNIPQIEKLMSYFKFSEFIIFENDSIDNTKEILKKWASTNKNVTYLTEDYHSETIPTKLSTNVNPYYSRYRISKMCTYRNKYLEYLDNNNYNADFIIIIDLDIPQINIEAIINSIKNKQPWDCIASNSYFYNKNLQKIYYDSYALIPLGHENIPQTEMSIIYNQFAFSKIKKGMELVPVYSAFGGVAIYKCEVLYKLRYTCIDNDDPRIEVKCEHFGLHHQIHNNGYNNFFIEPNLRFPYKKILDFKNVLRFIHKNS